MKRWSVPSSLRRRVAEEARHRCGYCLTPSVLIGTELEIDHLVPHSRGGETAELNLWLACAGCDDIKSDRLYATDAATMRSVRLFNPRFQSWPRHFEWLEGGVLIGGRTASGRATVALLRLNRPVLVRSRRLWSAAGLFPPSD